MSKPSVSVVVPVYNAAQYLAESVESILCQSWIDFELILIDDGSTDGSDKILQRYASLDPRIRVISRSNSGIVSAMNEGVRTAVGDFIAIMHADDISFHERLSRQVDYLRQNQDCVAVGSAILRVDCDGSPLYAETWTCDPAQVRQELLSGRGGLAHPAAMIRAESMHQVGGYRREFELVEDLDLWLRLDEIGALGNLPDVLLAYRRHTKTLSCQYDNKVRELLVEVVKDAYQRRGLVGEVSIQARVRRGDSVQRELSRWVRGAAANGSLDAASRHMWRLIVEYPHYVRTWSVFAQFLIRLFNHRILGQRFSEVETEKVALLDGALQGYRTTQALMAGLPKHWASESRANTSAVAESRRIA